MQCGRTLLHYATEHGMYDEVDALLANDADADSEDKVRILECCAEL